MRKERKDKVNYKLRKEIYHHKRSEQGIGYTVKLTKRDKQYRWKRSDNRSADIRHVTRRLYSEILIDHYKVLRNIGHYFGKVYHLIDVKSIQKQNKTQSVFQKILIYILQFSFICDIVFMNLFRGRGFRPSWCLPPSYCGYQSGDCNHSFDNQTRYLYGSGFFILIFHLYNFLFGYAFLTRFAPHALIVLRRSGQNFG